MSGKLNHKIIEVLRQDDLTQITDYMLHISELVVKDFSHNGRRLPNDENEIRTIILEEYLDADNMRKAYDMQEYSFEPETQENYDGNGNYIGRADIRVKLKTDFDKHSAYYLVECKRIDGSFDLNKKYVEKGVVRFVTGKYSSYYRKNIMMGFVVKKISISQNVRYIEQIQNAAPDTCMHGIFELVCRKGTQEMYRCVYRIKASELELRHIFFDFSDIVA